MLQPASDAAFSNVPSLGRDLVNAFAGSWWARQDSNLGPTDYESAALPLSYGPALATIS